MNDLVLRYFTRGPLKSWLTLAFLATLPTCGSAMTADSLHGLELSAGIGANWTHVDDASIIVSPYETDSAIVTHVPRGAIWQIGVGYHFFQEALANRPFFNDLLVGLDLYHTSETASGNTLQFQLPTFNNYSFSAPISTTRLMVNVRPSLFTYHRASFYPIAGMGVAWNRAQYNETATGAGVDPNTSLSLSGNEKSSFAYDVGAGMRFELTQHLAVSLEYLYADLGSVSPSNTSANGITVSSAPKFNLHDQSVIAGIKWTI